MLRLLALPPAAATAQPPQSAADLVAQGQELMAKRQYGWALRFFERAAELAPDGAEARTHAAQAWGQIAAALDRLDRPMRRLPPANELLRWLPPAPRYGQTMLLPSWAWDASTRGSQRATRR
jgi:hypothetical protein